MLSAVCLPGVAAADPIGFSGPMNFVGTGYGSAVSASLKQGGNTYTANWAGEINWLWGDQNASTPDAVPQGFAQSFYTYCVDITQFLNDPQSATVVSSNAFTGGVAYGGAKAAWLFNTFAEDIRNNTLGLSLTELNKRSAALQVAIWEALYDTVGNVTGGTATSGAFTLATTGIIRTQAQTYVDALYAAYSISGVSGWTSASALVLDTNSGQDQITRNVPEPSTLLLMGFGFFLAASLARRRERDVPS
jgi:hypothetical protein